MNRNNGNHAAGAARKRLRLRRSFLLSRAVPDEPLPQTPGIDPQFVTELESKIGALVTEGEQLRDVVVRQKAEFDNFRKRTQKEKEQIRDAAREDVISGLLPVIDNFDRAIQSAEHATDASGIREGISMVSSQLMKILEEHGLQKIEALNAAFDPNEHEALAVEERDDVEENHVCGVMLAGYRLKDRVIRPCMVKVAKRPAPIEETDPEPQESVKTE